MTSPSRFSIYWGLGPDNVPYQILDIKAWSEHMHLLGMHGRRHLGDHVVNGKRVSTVFLGINHQFGDGPPLLFETMVFKDVGSAEDEYTARYVTWQEAKDGHARVCEALRGAKPSEAFTDEQGR